MQSSSQRTVSPLAIALQVSLDAADLNNAFAAQPDPNEQLFYDTFGPGWDTKTTAEQLRLMADLCDLAQSTTALNPSIALESKGIPA